MASYNKEQATGDDRYNVLTIVMHQFRLALPDAMKWAVAYHEEIKKQFLDAMKRVPTWGKDIDEQTRQSKLGALDAALSCSLRSFASLTMS